MTQHFDGPFIIVDNTEDVGGQLRVDSEMDGAMAICAVRSKDKDAVMPELHANARRIAACLNACEGLTTEQLEQGQSIKTADIVRVLDALQTLTEATEQYLEGQPYSKTLSLELALARTQLEQHKSLVALL